MKNCTKTHCTEVNPQKLDNFHKSNSTRDGHKTVCKSCIKLQTKTYYKNNKAKINKYSKEWAKNNPDKIKEALRKHKENNPDSIKKSQVKYRENNKEKILLSRVKNKENFKIYLKQYKQDKRGKIAALNARREKRIKVATPKWLSREHHLEIEKLHDLRISLNESTEIIHHVDHIIPIKGKNVCGLHVPWNMRVITADQNLSKHNKLMDYS